MEKSQAERPKVYSPVPPRGLKINALYSAWKSEPERYEAEFFSAVRRMCAGHELAQRSLVVLLKLLPSFVDETGRSFYYFAKKIIGLQGLALRKEISRESGRRVSWSEDEFSGIPSDGLEERISDLRAKLNTSDRRLFDLYRMGYGVQEIANLCKVDVRTVRRRTNKLRENAALLTD